MGWTTTYKPSGVTASEYLVERYSGGNYKVLDSSVVNFNTAYFAVEKQNEDGSIEVFAMIALLRYYPKEHYYNFGYKMMDETEGANESKCPERILKLLTPTENEYASAWRKRCWDNINKRKSAPKVGKGDVIKLANPVRFTNGKSYQTFVRIDSRALEFKVAIDGDNGHEVLYTGYHFYILRRADLLNCEVVGHIEL